MPSVEQRVTAWIGQATPSERRAGPTVTELGGVSEEEANEIAMGPFLPELVKATSRHQDAGDRSDAEILGKAVVLGLRNQQRQSAFAGALDALVTRPKLARALGSGLAKSLLGRLDDLHRTDDDPAVAVIAADATEYLVQLALTQITPPARLLGELAKATDEIDQLPELFAVRLPRMLGILEAHYPGTGPAEALERLLELDHTCRDATFEIAMAELRLALEATDIAPMLEKLTAVRRRLSELLAQSPERLDARIYHTAIDAALALGGPEAETRVPAIAGTLREALEHYRAWRYRSESVWSRQRQSDISAWAELTIILDTAAAHMGENDPWYSDGREILSALLNAYTADRTVTVLQYSATAAFVEQLIAPTVEDVFIQNENRLRFLQHAVDKDEVLRADPASIQLLSALRARESPPEKDEAVPDPDGRGKARRWHLLAQAVGPVQFDKLTKQADKVTLDRLEIKLRTHEDVVTSIADPKVTALMESLILDLEQSADWTPEIATPFQALLNTTIRYAFLCYDITRKMGGSFTEYLRLRDSSGKKQKVDEELFHQHFFEVLAVSAFFRVVQAEVINNAGGRVDIQVSFGPIRFNVECKIEEKDATEKGLRHYASQAAEYQNTNASFAILLVLDKTEHAEGTVKIFDSIWIENVQRPGDSEPCKVVTIRIPGGRDAPSSLNSPALVNP